MKFCEEKLQISQKILVAADGSKFICKRVFIYLDKKQVNKQQGLLPYQEHEYHIPLKAKDVRPLSCYCQGCRQGTQCHTLGTKAIAHSKATRQT